MIESWIFNFCCDSYMTWSIKTSQSVFLTSSQAVMLFQNCLSGRSTNCFLTRGGRIPKWEQSFFIKPGRRPLRLSSKAETIPVLGMLFKVVCNPEYCRSSRGSVVGGRCSYCDPLYEKYRTLHYKTLWKVYR